jgi:hypothetical protein
MVHRGQKTKSMKKLFILGLSLCLVAPLTLQAHDDPKTKTKLKGHYVKTKFKKPKYTKGTSPGDNYVYVDQDWTWNDATHTYDWNGNRWVERRQPTQKWVPGHWKHTAGGWTWVDGQWK